MSKTESKNENINALGEPLWIDILKSIRSFLILMLVVAVIGGGLGIAIIAPWGRASPDCSIYCVIENKLGDPIQWSKLETDNLSNEMISEIVREMTYLGFSYKMPNYKQYQVSLNGDQYDKLIKAINGPILERKNPSTGKGMNIVEDLYSIIKSNDYALLGGNNSKLEKIKIFKNVFNQRKNIVLKNLYQIEQPLYTRAAEEGDADAQYNLGVMYYKGQGLPQNIGTAVKWYTLSAEQGNVKAQYNLGMLYNKGQSIPQDFKAAANG